MKTPARGGRCCGPTTPGLPGVVPSQGQNVTLMLAEQVVVPVRQTL